MTGASGGRKQRSNPQLRIISAVVLGVVTLALTWLGGPWFRFFAAALAALMVFEWAAMIGASRHRAHVGLMWLATAVIALAILFGLDQRTVLALVAACAGAVLVAGLSFGQGPAAAVGVAYAGLSGAALAFLRGDGTTGLWVILFLFAVVWSTDIAAYYVGRAVGGPKLAPSISPGKTQSGALGGLAAAVVAGLAVAAATGGGIVVAGIAALVLSVVSQAGDLAESAAKRRYGVKDSGFLIPGHGGVMDRVDGLVAAAIALYALFLLMPSALRPWQDVIPT